MRTDCPVVAIVGAGPAGTLTAVHLLRSARPVEVVLIDRDGSFATGRAYRTPDPGHLLNQPAARMSAFAGEPDHFRRWVAAHGGDASPAAFHPRGLYGDYLREVLAEARGGADPRLRLVAGEVTEIEPAGDGAWLRLVDGRALRCDRVVLAVGPMPARRPAGLPIDRRVVCDPWAPGALSPVAPGATALVVGSGLTAVDAALSLTSAGGRVVAVSRGGSLPRVHRPRLGSPVLPHGPWPADAAALEALVRRHVAEVRSAGWDWRDGVDGVRVVAPELWGALPAAERRRLLRTRMRTWEVHRHRMAPEVGARVRALRSEGRLEILGGELARVQATPSALEAVLRTRSGPARRIRAARIVACTGPGCDVRVTRDRLLRGLIAKGHAVPDALGLGLRTTPSGALLDFQGRASGVVWALGALRRGDLWESTAIAEIREQARAVAEEMWEVGVSYVPVAEAVE